MTIEQYLKQYGDRRQEYRLVATVDELGITSFYIHPLDRNGDTPVFHVVDNRLSLVVVEFPVQTA